MPRRPPEVRPGSLARARARIAGAWRRAQAVGCVAVGLSAGCVETIAPPVVEDVSPVWGYNGESTDVEIGGARFFPTVIVSEASPEGGRVEGAFEAWLEGIGDPVRLDDVRHLSYDRLAAEVPAGLTPGTYDLRVEVPSGLDAVLQDAFTVTDTRADHLDLFASDASHVVGGLAAITITLQDPADRTVPLAFEVVVTAVPTDGPGSTVQGVRFEDDWLHEQEPLGGDAVGVRGKLGADGTGVVLVTSDVATDLQLVVAPADGGFVRTDDQTLSFDPGPVHAVVLSLPSSPFETVAGDSFDLGIRFEDRLGNVLAAESSWVTLRDSCLNEITPQVQIVGQGSVPVRLTAACDDATITAFVFGREWVSPPFDVVPGPLAGYDLQAWPTQAVAGSEVYLFVDAVDRYGNIIEDHVADLEIRDNVGGLEPDLNIGRQACPGFIGGIQVCTLWPWGAGDEVILRAQDGGTGAGAAAPIEVLPADPNVVLVELAVTRVAAGETFEVGVRVIDAYANSVPIDPGGSNPVEFEDTSGTIDCDWTGADDGAQLFDCTIEGAVANAAVAATVRDLRAGSTVFDLRGETPDPLLVTNGPLAFVELDPQGASFVAGGAFTLQLRGYDAYDNPYVVQTDPVLDLADTAGTMTPATAVLGPAGTAQVSAVIYRAGEGVRVYARQDGVRLGMSRALNVAPAALDGFDVEVPPWISVDEPADVVVTAVDAYGNAIVDYAGTVQLGARGGACEDVTITDFDDGVARLSLTCDTPTLSEALLARDEDDVEGTSDVVDVVDLFCADGPTAALTLDGDDDTVRCLAEGGTVSVVADTSASTRGAAGIAVRHFADGRVEERTLGADRTLTYDETGLWRVQTLVVDANACADLAEGTVYVGADDGEPAGPIEVSLSSTTAYSTSSSVTVTVEATDCTGDVAAYQDVVVRADLGTPGGTASGQGLRVTLGGTGVASFPWSFDTGYTGAATLHVGSTGGGAFGSGGVQVTQDAALPEIVSIDPTGAVSGVIDRIEVVFTEPMRRENATATQIGLTGPGGSVAASFDLSTDRETLTITPNTPLTASAGTWTLTFSTSVRDAGGGNQLDGAWTNAPASFSTTFGSVPTALPTVSSCDLDTERFTPDGDAGSGEEADVVSLTPTATASPTWWWLVVADRDGERVRSLRQPGTDGAVAWDGRGDDGMIAPSGSYSLQLRAVDTYGNVGEACDGTVQLQQHVDAP